MNSFRDLKTLLLSDACWKTFDIMSHSYANGKGTEGTRKLHFITAVLPLNVQPPNNVM